ncbi:hypothetical protein [Nesterenkonia marinintestina]|uniref:hypothetical protein n=1 Tax=Nesterenkonia marinintestina TaxID=2979865 RepID=UPI0021C1914F|nr:hypothetical protein [Nesterenkonia sp. GX14115]
MFDDEAYQDPEYDVTDREIMAVSEIRQMGPRIEEMIERVEELKRRYLSGGIEPHRVQAADEGLSQMKTAAERVADITGFDAESRDGQGPVTIKRRWWRDPAAALSVEADEHSTRDAETLIEQCDQVADLEAKQWSTGGPSTVLRESIHAWDYQGGDVIDLKDQLDGGDRRIPADVMAAYRRVEAARPDLDVYLEPEPVLIPDEESSQKQLAEQASWSVVADHPESRETARLDFLTMNQDREIHGVHMVSGTVKPDAPWRSWSPEHDIEADRELQVSGVVYRSSPDGHQAIEDTFLDRARAMRPVSEDAEVTQAGFDTHFQAHETRVSGVEEQLELDRMQPNTPGRGTSGPELT